MRNWICNKSEENKTELVIIPTIYVSTNGDHHGHDSPSRMRLRSAEKGEGMDIDMELDDSAFH